MIDFTGNIAGSALLENWAKVSVGQQMEFSSFCDIVCLRVDSFPIENV